MPVLHHALLGVSVLALAAAGVRAASPVVERGLARALAAAVFAVAAAVAAALLLGLLALGGSTAALTLAAIATWGAAVAWLPRPAVGVGSELLGWWRARSAIERAGAGALVGAAFAWVLWELRHPGLGFDTVHYHAPEMVIFVQGGHPGSIHDVLPGLPVGWYPLTTEVSISWAMAIGRSWVPVVLWPWAALTLMATSTWVGLRALGVARLAAGLAAAALCTSPWLLAWQSNGSVTDGSALAFLVTCGALCALSRDRPAMLVPAIVAGGLAIGCKTTVVPFVLLALAIALVRDRRRLRAVSRPALAAATGLATIVGGYWYVRNMAAHGSPFWPIATAPWGTPPPRSVALIQTSFLERPRATLDLIGDDYLDRFGGSLLLLAAGSAAALAAWRGRVVAASAAVVGGVVVWAASPITGLALEHTLPETVYSTTRYLLPVVAAACLALALAATDGRRFRVPALLLLAAAIAVNLAQTLALEAPVAPSGFVPLAGALAGALLAVAAGRLAGRRDGLPRIPAWPAAVCAAVIAGALLALPADGFVRRHGYTGEADVARAARWLAADPSFASGDEPLATTPAHIAPLAGDRLQHRLVAIPRGETCAALARRARTQWLVVYGGPLGGKAPAEVRRCLPAPLRGSPTVVVYRPAGAARAAGH
jgi:hypothetical protein